MRRYALIAVGAFLLGALLTGTFTLIAHNNVPSPVVERDRGGDVWGADYFPNIQLTTHDGRQVRFFDDLLKDKVVAINFVYTYCPDTCPVETARMLQVARLLGDRLGVDVFFYSITIDPDHDTQPVLQEFADSWKIPDGWTFLTGNKEEIIHLRQKMGMRIDDVKTKDLSDHTVNLLIGNQATGRWMKRSPFENPYVLANQLGSWLHGWKEPSQVKRDYEDAPELRTISDGEYMFRNLCSACHTIGQGDIHDLARQHIGPDLLNISQQRDREWLIRWLMEPDVMLEEGDPLAVALAAQYQNIPMPNLRLTEKDATALLGYLDQESRRINGMQAAQEGHVSGEAEGTMDHSQHTGMNHGDHGHHGEG